MPGGGGDGPERNHSRRRSLAGWLRCSHAIGVERLDPKPLDVRATDSKRVEVNSLQLSVGLFWRSQRSSTASLRLGLFALLAALVPGISGAVAPVLIQNAPGRFEISAIDPTVAHGVASAAEEGWRILASPLALPDAFPSPIFVRVVPATERLAGAAPFQVTVEVGGVVSVRLRGDAATLSITRRALVQGLLMRLAVAQHGVSQRLTVPLWLEHGCVGWWETRTAAAQLDALKQNSMREQVPSFDALIGWTRGAEESRTYSRGSTWLFTFLQSESGRAREWPTLLVRLLNGDDALVAVAISYPGRYRSALERELWWQTGYHHLCRGTALPSLEAVESREQLGALARFVFAGTSEDADVVVPLATTLAHAHEPVVAAELARRGTELSKLIRNLHPFYRNAGLSLGEAFAARNTRPSAREKACAAFEQDWRDAVELETSTRSALEALEGGASVESIR